jgi:hypothetical protein
LSCSAVGRLGKQQENNIDRLVNRFGVDAAPQSGKQAEWRPELGQPPVLLPVRGNGYGL